MGKTNHLKIKVIIDRNNVSVKSSGPNAFKVNIYSWPSNILNNVCKAKTTKMESLRYLDEFWRKSTEWIQWTQLLVLVLKSRRLKYGENVSKVVFDFKKWEKWIQRKKRTFYGGMTLWSLSRLLIPLNIFCFLFFVFWPYQYKRTKMTSRQ